MMDDDPGQAGTISPASMLEWLEGQIRSRIDWLETHGGNSRKRWPDHDIEAKKYGLNVMYALRNLIDGGAHNDR